MSDQAAHNDHSDPPEADSTDASAVGDTEEPHDELSPRDMPLGHPSKPEVERQYAEAHKHDEPAAGEEQER